MLILDVCEESPSSGLSPPPFYYFMDKLTPKPCFMQIIGKSSTTLQAHTDRWRHLSALDLSQINTLACFLESFSQISGCHF